MDTIRVDFHCHSVHSDGTLTPRELAELLAADGVVVAALTDHNSVDGLKEFRRALARREVGFIPAVEITTQFEDREVHLLGYGIDTTNSELISTLASLRHVTPPGVHSVADSLRTKGAASTDNTSTIPDGRIDIIDAIALVHRAGGRAFLAHPFLIESDVVALEAIVSKLKAHGLDGIESYYAPYTMEERETLYAVAQRGGLLVCAGSDTHQRRVQTITGIEIPTTVWKSFRDAIGSGTSNDLHRDSSKHAPSNTRFNWRNFIFHFIFPTFLAIALFISAIYAVFLPAFEQSLIDRKREMIRELTNSAWSILAGFATDVKDGRLTREQAQELAILHISSLRYGKDGKDYFWLQDMQPRIVMHPYRPDLNGKDVSTFRDPRGVAIFVAFADLVKRNQQGYAVYVWQWNDDPNRLVPKESYVKGFAPWGWIIGTGLYIEDVTNEINRIERSLVNTALVISIVVVLLLLYVIFESLRLERERAEVEQDLHESTERYRSLVESTTEGTLLVMDDRCRYANHILLEMLACSPGELELLDVRDLLPETKNNTEAWLKLRSLLQGNEVKGGFDAVLQRRDGKLIDCILTLSRISVAGREGYIIHSRSVALTFDAASTHESIKRDQGLLELIDESPVGIFRARVSARGALTTYNKVAANLLTANESSQQQSLALADCFVDSAAYEEFFQELQRVGMAVHHQHQTQREMSSRTIAIVAKLIRDDQAIPKWINGSIEDVTTQIVREAELEATIERLQTPLLFLHEPISRLTQRAVQCPLDTPVDTVAMMMTDQQASAALILAESGAIVGIVTDGDIRKRVVAPGLEKDTPAHRIMSAPIVTINEQAVIFEALLLMEQRHINHLAVADDTGRIVGTICHQELLQFQQYGPIVLTREIELAATPNDVVRCCKRVPGLVKVLLDCGAHAHVMNRLISSVCDATTKKFITFAEAKFGQSSVPYVFLSLGSQGRQEMTLSSDQDNAIVYMTPSDPAQGTGIEEHLLAVGRFVCEWLDRAGYPFCRGDIMAQNPHWCKSLTTWKTYFREWIENAEPQQLLKFTIFFDFHPVYGSPEIALELRQYVLEQLRERPAFYPHFAQNSLQFKPPKRLFGRFLGGSGSKELSGTFDLKDTVIPIVSFARLYALRQGIDATNTLERLQRLTETDVLNEISSQAIAEAFEFLTRLNIKQQAEAIVAGQVVDNKIHPRILSPIEQTLLHQSFAEIEAIQKRISYDFLSGMV